MSTTSTAPAVINALLKIDPERSFESWPGPEAKAEMLVLGADPARPPILWDGDEGYRIATIKADRKHRQESYDIAFEVFIMGADDTTPAAPKAARDRAFEFLAEYENALANNVVANVEGGFANVQWIQITPAEAGPRVFEHGWAYRIAGTFRVAARLL